MSNFEPNAPASKELAKIRSERNSYMRWCVIFVGVILLGAQHIEAQEQVRRQMRSAMRQMEPRVRPSVLDGSPQFAGRWSCSDDCSGHLAGWRWAVEHSVRKADECEGSNSESFFEGCQIYLWATGRAAEPD